MWAVLERASVALWVTAMAGMELWKLQCVTTVRSVLDKSRW